uniref:Putative basic tail protein n=1 Tax=Ixodes ricinus TaxID=34613 RepID=A0A0K8RGT6_IXORI
MPAVSLFIVIVACLAGQITCAELDPALKRCPDEEFHKPGYSLGCTYTCRNGPPEDENEYWGNYRDATVCVVLENGDPNKFKHIGTCKNGACVQYEGDHIEQVWRKLPELQAEFHHCPQIKTDDIVDNCLYICQKSDDPRGPGYFYGIYLDYHRCNFKGGDGQCRSGLCIDGKIAGQYPIEN